MRRPLREPAPVPEVFARAGELYVRMDEMLRAIAWRNGYDDPRSAASIFVQKEALDPRVAELVQAAFAGFGKPRRGVVAFQRDDHDPRGVRLVVRLDWSPMPWEIAPARYIP